MPFSARTGFFSQPAGSPPGPTLWTPAELTTVVWLDAQDSANITVDGSGNVSDWGTKNGGTESYSQGNSK